MKQLFISLVALITVGLAGCTSAKKSQLTSHIIQNTSICDKTVQYIVEKFKMFEGGNDLKVHAEITVDPLAKNINLKGIDPEKGKISFDTQIESAECSFNSTLTEGQAIYKGYIIQPDGRKTYTSILIENKDGQLYIKPADEQEKAEYFMVVDRWEIIEN